MKLQGKVALITGTSPNICGGIAEGMAEEGAKIVCVDVQPDNANLCADYLNKRGGQAIGVVCDVTNEDQVKAAVERAARWGKSYGDPRIVGLLEEVRKGVPMQKLPSPRHYARAAVFLASDDAEMITGTDLRVDAGTVARYWAWTPEDKT